MSDKRILFTEEDFKTLISGKIVEKQGVQIALQDIGYDVMFELLITEMDKNN